MPIPSSINDLSTTAGSNSPGGSESPSLIDNYFRTHASFIAQLRDDALIKASPLIGAATNLYMTVSAASASAAVAADEIVVGTTLGATTYRLANFSKTINLATTGINAMDTGTAPVSGWVAVYAIYNPTTSTAALLGVNSPNTFMPTIYGGANMPAGYTASALLTVVPTNASRQIKICSVRGRKVGIQLAQAYTVTGSVTNQVVTPTSVIPANAIEVFGELQTGSTGASALALAVFSDTNNINQQILANTVSAGQTVAGNFSGLMITTPQQFVASTSSTGGSPTFTVYFSGYWI
jgi:hypothetical protein